MNSYIDCIYFTFLYGVGKNHINATCVTLHSLRQVIWRFMITWILRLPAWENVKSHSLHLFDVSTVRFQMCVEIASLSGRKVTLAAFVWLFSTVCFQMSPQSTCITGSKVTLVAFEWLFSTVCSQMCPQITCLRRCIVALVAFVWYKPYYQSRCGLKKPGCQSEAEGRGLAAWFFKTTSRLVVRFNILSDITGRTPELKCRFENHWQARLLRPGGPKV